MAPRTISSAMPETKPVITEWATKRIRVPIFSSPNASWNTPMSTARVTRAASFCSAGTYARASPAATDSAPVVDTFMKTELVKRAPTGVATISV